MTKTGRPKNATLFERNKEILRLFESGMKAKEIGPKFNLKPSRIYVIVEQERYNEMVAQGRRLP